MSDNTKLALVGLTFIGTAAAIAMFGFWTVMSVIFGAAVASALMIGLLS